MMNESLNKMSLSKAILFTDRGNINESTYINYGGWHLRTRSSKIFGKNILNVEKKLGVSDWNWVWTYLIDLKSLWVKKKKNFIPDKDEFKLAKSSKQTNGTLSSPRQQRPN